MSDLGEFVEKLRMERLRARMLQCWLAEAVGVSPSVLSRWERGRTVPPDYALKRWARALDIAVPAGVRGGGS
jgi:transcriptional regulator with XRE-family HTH domain